MNNEGLGYYKVGNVHVNFLFHICTFLHFSVVYCQPHVTENPFFCHLLCMYVFFIYIYVFECST